MFTVAMNKKFTGILVGINDIQTANFFNVQKLDLYLFASSEGGVARKRSLFVILMIFFAWSVFASRVGFDFSDGACLLA